MNIIFIIKNYFCSNSYYYNNYYPILNISIDLSYIVIKKENIKVASANQRGTSKLIRYLIMLIYSALLCI